MTFLIQRWKHSSMAAIIMMTHVINRGSVKLTLFLEFFPISRLVLNFLPFISTYPEWDQQVLSFIYYPLCLSQMLRWNRLPRRYQLILHRKHRHDIFPPELMGNPVFPMRKVLAFSPVIKQQLQKGGKAASSAMVWHIIIIYCSIRFTYIWNCVYCVLCNYS